GRFAFRAFLVCPVAFGRATRHPELGVRLHAPGSCSRAGSPGMAWPCCDHPPLDGLTISSTHKHSATDLDRSENAGRCTRPGVKARAAGAEQVTAPAARHEP